VNANVFLIVILISFIILVSELKRGVI